MIQKISLKRWIFNMKIKKTILSKMEKFNNKKNKMLKMYFKN